MIKDLQYQIFSIIIHIIIIILGIIISLIGSYIIKFVKSKNSELVKNIGVAKYNSYKSVAMDIWNIVEEYFRINPLIDSYVNNKCKMFNDLLKKKFPDLNQEDIDFIRQTIAGEINKI